MSGTIYMSTHEVNLFMKTFQTYESHGIVQQFLHIFQWICAVYAGARHNWQHVLNSCLCLTNVGTAMVQLPSRWRGIRWWRCRWRRGRVHRLLTVMSCAIWLGHQSLPFDPIIRGQSPVLGDQGPRCRRVWRSGRLLIRLLVFHVKAIGTGACGELEAASCSSGFLSSKASLWSSNPGHGDRDADAVRARFCSNFRSHCSNLAWASLPVHPPLAPTTSWKPRWMLQICIWIRRAVMVALDGCTSKVPSAICRITTSGSEGVPGCCPALAWGSNSKTIFLPGIRMARPRTSMAQGVLLTGSYRAKVQDTWSHVHFRRQDRKLPKTGTENACTEMLLKAPRYNMTKD